MPASLRKLIRYAALFLPCILLASCASSKLSGGTSPIAVLGDGADMYVYVPVKENTSLVQNVMSAGLGMKPDDAALICSRLDSLYLSSKNGGDFGLYAEGSFPAIARNVALSEKNGWTKSSYTPKGSALKIDCFSSEYGISAAFPTSSILIAAGKISPLLDRYAFPPAAEPECLEWFDGTEHDGGAIVFYAAEPAPLMRKLVGAVAERWCDSVYGEIKKTGRTSFYSLTCFLELSEPRMLKALEAIITLAGLNVSETGEKTLRIDGLVLTETDLMNVIR